MVSVSFETEVVVDGEIQLTDALTKLDELWGMVLFEGRTYNVATCFDWWGGSLNLVLRIPQE